MTPALDLDTRLMVRVQSGCSESFGQLLNRNRTMVVQFLWRMVRNEAVAEDLAQDVFIRVYRSRQSYEPTAKFTTWLLRITTNVALNHLRDEKRHLNDISLDSAPDGHRRRETPDSALLMDDLLVRDVVAAQIRLAIRALPPKQRAAVVMHKYHDMEYARIGQVLGCTPSAVKAMMFRAYQTLRGRLAHLYA